MNPNSPWSQISAQPGIRNSDRARIPSMANINLQQAPVVMRLPQIIEPNTQRQRTLSNH